ncbi:hypothetical protein [Actinomadura geliboluensis]|uniref:hypothetical protein n=1 Tax=Actinomadura geliboluensis TaxID=882440 RepID=UPI002628AE4D|nr:hypothetical protein [Actinomadura geliboluensis]
MGDLDLRDVGAAVIYLGMIAGALAAIGIVVRVVVVRPLQKWLREQIKPQLAEVHAEVTPNHGGSIKDQVTRIDQRLTDHLTNHPGASS